MIILNNKQNNIINMKKALFLIAALVMSAATFEAKADLFNIGGVRTNIYSYSTKSFEGAESETREMPLISGISNNGPLNIVYIQSDKSEVVVMGEKALFNRVQTQYKNGVVNVSLEPGTYRNLWIQVVVYAPSLNSIKCTGSGNVKAEKVTSNAEEMSVKVTGSAIIAIEQLECSRNLDFHISGSGDIRTNETSCQMLDVNITGSGDVIAQKTKFFNMDANVTGSGGMKFVELDGNQAELNVKGSGNIKLEGGNIKYVKARVLGSGSIAGDIKYESLDQNSKGSGFIRFK